MKKILLIILILVVALNVESTKHYVATTGSNSTGDGSLALPWKDFAFALCGGAYGCSCAVANTHKVRAGDTLFARGGTYKEHAIAICSTGYRTNRITIKSYPGEYATIDAESLETVFQLGRNYNNNWITFDSLHMIGGKIWHIVTGENNKCSSVVVKNCLFENHIFRSGQNCAAVEFLNANSINDTVINCKIIGNDYNNYNYDGIQVMFPDGSCFINNDISHVTRGIFWKHRSAVGNRASWPRQSIIKNNFIHDCLAQGILVTNNHVSIINNLVVNCTGGPTGHSGIRLNEDGGTTAGSHCRVEHNTVYNCKNGLFYSWESRVDTSLTPNHRGPSFDTSVNNVFHTYGTENLAYCIWPYAPDSAFGNPPNDSSNWNLYYNTVTSNVVRVQDTNRTLDQYRAATTYDDNSLQGVPTFVSSSGDSAGRWKLAAGSLGKGAASDGTDMGCNTDSVGVLGGAGAPEPPATNDTTLTVTCGTAAWVKNTALTGYRTNGFAVDSGKCTYSDSCADSMNVTPVGTVVIKGYFKKTYPFTISATSGTTVPTIGSTTRDTAEVIAISHTPAAEYGFKNWEGIGGEFDGDSTHFTILANAVVTAVDTLNPIIPVIDSIAPVAVDSLGEDTIHVYDHLGGLGIVTTAQIDDSIMTCEPVEEAKHVYFIMPEHITLGAKELIISNEFDLKDTATLTVTLPLPTIAYQNQTWELTVGATTGRDSLISTGGVIDSVDVDTLPPGVLLDSTTWAFYVDSLTNIGSWTCIAKAGNTTGTHSDTVTITVQSASSKNWRYYWKRLRKGFGF